MTMRWEHLTFLHAPVAPELIRAHIPEVLTIDTYPDSEGNEMAWIGLVPFKMVHVRPRNCPRAFTFPETNVRTYVHFYGEPGVWFFSLDAANLPAVLLARLRWQLPYHWASMGVHAHERDTQFSSTRVFNREAVSVIAESPDLPFSEPIPGSLEHYFVERYRLFSIRKRGHQMTTLYAGLVDHEPYKTRPVKGQALRCSLPFTEAISRGDWVSTLEAAPLQVKAYPIQELLRF